MTVSGWTWTRLPTSTTQSEKTTTMSTHTCAVVSTCPIWLCPCRLPTTTAGLSLKCTTSMELSNSKFHLKSATESSILTSFSFLATPFLVPANTVVTGPATTKPNRNISNTPSVHSWTSTSSEFPSQDQISVVSMATTLRICAASGYSPTRCSHSSETITILRQPTRNSTRSDSISKCPSWMPWTYDTLSSSICTICSCSPMELASFTILCILPFQKTTNCWSLTP